MPRRVVDSGKCQNTVELSYIILFPDKQDPKDLRPDICQVCPPYHHFSSLPVHVQPEPVRWLRNNLEWILEYKVPLWTQ